MGREEDKTIEGNSRRAEKRNERVDVDKSGQSGTETKMEPSLSRVMQRNVNVHNVWEETEMRREM